VEQTIVYYQQHLDRQARPSRWLADITLLDIMTFVVLAVWMGHALKDTLQDHNKYASEIIYPVVLPCVLFFPRLTNSWTECKILFH
jgi:hypothetical protein